MMADQFADLTVKIFADGAAPDGIRALSSNPLIKGFTTNPTLMRAAGVTDYEAFARDVLKIVRDRPVSFEVLSDDFAEMEQQALKLSALGDNVFVKIPITNTKGESTAALLRHLSSQGLKLNVTALMTVSQVETAAKALIGGSPGFVSVFAGRIADTGRDPVPILREALELLAGQPELEVIWASPREVLNIFQASDIGCHVITVTHHLLDKLAIVGHDLEAFSIETVQMFFNDARAAGFSL